MISAYAKPNDLCSIVVNGCVKYELQSAEWAVFKLLDLLFLCFAVGLSGVIIPRPLVVFTVFDASSIDAKQSLLEVHVRKLGPLPGGMEVGKTPRKQRKSCERERHNLPKDLTDQRSGFRLRNNNF